MKTLGTKAPCCTKKRKRTHNLFVIKLYLLGKSRFIRIIKINLHYHVRQSSDNWTRNDKWTDSVTTRADKERFEIGYKTQIVCENLKLYNAYYYWSRPKRSVYKWSNEPIKLQLLLDKRYGVSLKHAKILAKKYLLQGCHKETT